MSNADFQKKVNIKPAGSGTFAAVTATNATLNFGAETLDDTDFTNTGYRSRVLGLKDYSINMTVNYDVANTEVVLLRTSILTGVGIDFQYLPNGTAGFAGTGFIETLTHSGDVAGLETMDVTIQSDGTALTTV